MRKETCRYFLQVKIESFSKNWKKWVNNKEVFALILMQAISIKIPNTKASMASMKKKFNFLLIYFFSSTSEALRDTCVCVLHALLCEEKTFLFVRQWMWREIIVKRRSFKITNFELIKVDEKILFSFKKFNPRIYQKTLFLKLKRFSKNFFINSKINISLWFKKSSFICF